MNKTSLFLDDRSKRTSTFKQTLGTRFIHFNTDIKVSKAKSHTRPERHGNIFILIRRDTWRTTGGSRDPKNTRAGIIYMGMLG